ncbi:MAG TPA: MarR family winged helix-turn-helix transcriptional regulator [Steroidobacteraceae bacterium]|jgi:DNA-binding MarR family transcriptional regulator|nr:MarR family winged helix-turn-helix transcriptional regulator [Steroidobacteraceae bacterium]
MKVLTAEVDRDLPITLISVFAGIAAAPEGVDQKELMDALVIGSSSMSRAVQTLSDLHYMKGKPGLGLISRGMDLQDNKRRILKLTEKGMALSKKLSKVLS